MLLTECFPGLGHPNAVHGAQSTDPSNGSNNLTTSLPDDKATTTAPPPPLKPDIQESDERPRSVVEQLRKKILRGLDKEVRDIFGKPFQTRKIVAK